jgi:hypothetical protein
MPMLDSQVPAKDEPPANEEPSPAKASTSQSKPQLVFDLQGRLRASTQPHEHLHSHHEHHSHDPEEFTVDQLSALIRSSMAQQRVSGLTIAARVIEANPQESSVNAFAEELISTLSGYLGKSNHLGILSASLKCLLTILDKPKLVEYALAQQPSLLDAFATLLGRGSPIQDSRHLAIEVVKCLLICSSEDGSAPDSIVAHSTLLSNLCTFCLKTSWPSSSASELPISLALQLLCQLASLSRANASAIATLPAVNLSMRFFALPYWTIEDVQGRSAGREVVLELLQLLTCLARYGFGLEARSKIWMTQFELSRAEQRDAGLDQAWFALVQHWLACALNTHETTPEHAILWSQVEVLGNDLEDAVAHYEHFKQNRIEADVLDSIRVWNAAIKQLRLSARAKISPIHNPAERLQDYCKRELDVESEARTLFAAIQLATSSSEAVSIPVELADEVASVLDKQLQVTKDQAQLHLFCVLAPFVSNRAAHICTSLALLDSQSLSLLPDLLPAFFDSLETLSADSQHNHSVLQPFLIDKGPVAPFSSMTQSLKEVQRVQPRLGDSKLWSASWALQVPVRHLTEMETSFIWRKLPTTWNFTELDILKAALETQLAVIDCLAGKCTASPLERS